VVQAGGRNSLPDVVTIVADNLAPVVQAGCACDPGPLARCNPTTCTILHGLAGKLDGRNSLDPDGDSLTFTWTQVTDSTSCGQRCPGLAACNPTALAAVPTMASTTLASFTAPFASNAQVVYVLTADDMLQSAEACVRWTVINNPPLFTQAASASVSMVDEGTMFTLTGDGGDSDSDPVTFLWEQSSGTPAATLATPNLRTTSATAPMVGADTTLRFRLTISDGLDPVPSPEVSVTIRNL